MPTTSSSSNHPPPSVPALTWRPTKIMHMRDLSKDDDFLSHLLVEKLGTGTVPLLVHKMDASRRLPKTDSADLVKIVRRLVTSKGPIHQVMRQAVDELLTLSSIRYYLKSYTQKQINAFATHASRYFELYHPSGCIEIAHTSRYSHRTGKSELCILATRNLAPGAVITELKGSMANLTEEEDKELKRTDLRNSDIRRDFSVIHSKSMKKNHLFLGPARFVNHDCDNNCELFREGRYITFRVLRPIAIGEEITAHYGDGYFGKKNKHCLCETCEKNGRGGYSPDHQDDDSDSSSDSNSNSDSDSDSTSSESEAEAQPKPLMNMNERRTRRGVYAVMKPESDDSDDSDDDEGEEDRVPLAHAQDIPADGDIELTSDADAGSDLTSLAPSVPSSSNSSPAKRSKPTTPRRAHELSRSSSSLTDLSSPETEARSGTSTPFRSIISTRRQKAHAATTNNSKSNTPAIATSKKSSIEPVSRPFTRSISTSKPVDKKGKAKAVTPTTTSTPSANPGSKASGKDVVRIKKEENEVRILRGRQTSGVQEVSKEPPKPDIPRGPDGKPLPICSTCSNVLPLIAVDSKVVWGLGLEASPKKRKNAEMECPRCLRHFAIYQQKWPSRVAPHGTAVTPRDVSSTPAESISKRVTHRGLETIDRKLAAVLPRVKLITGTKRARKGEDGEEEPVRKRAKNEVTVVISKPKVTKTYSTSARKARTSTPEPEAEPSPKRKRGRPRSTSTVLHSATKESAGIKSASTTGVSRQPRATNGRFGKKDKNLKKAALALKTISGSGPTASQPEIKVEKLDEEAIKATWVSPRRKRSDENAEELVELPPRKRVASSANLKVATSHRVMPHPPSAFGQRLFSKPSPLHFALHAWKSPVIFDDSSSEDEKHPITPEDEQAAAPVEILNSNEQDSSSFLPRAPIVARPPQLHSKPTPFLFARNRWQFTTRVTPPPAQKKVTAHGLPEIPTWQKEQYFPNPDDAELSPDDDDERADNFPSSSLSPLSSSEGESPDTKLRHAYPVYHPQASRGFIPKTSTFPTSSSPTKPRLVNAGWDDASDESET
ncbi:hypothetical protein CVT24_005150 [Panaeolus cyanescens]|uniref:SET domain-containing protein n=1 Tax=Panaeolus cyanescens TaxID=181874 RepID=A0A409V9R1_9AGAR|nr:hypothetical protein CVT24_005150 [Panaeolus cyanescens]